VTGRSSSRRVGRADGDGRVKSVVATGLVTVGLILWAHRLPTIGGRVPLVFVALWFGSSTMVALVFAEGSPSPGWAAQPRGATRQHLWRYKMLTAALCLLPLTVVPLLERHGVGNDPAVWLLDCALLISLCTVPYFTLVARTVVGGAVLSIGAFQALWTCGASALFVVMEHLESAQGRTLTRAASFEAFFRPEYRYLFYILCAVMLLGYCPVLLWRGHRRFLRPQAPASHSAVAA